MTDSGLIEKVEEIARKHGFECVGTGNAADLRVREEARKMCEANTCGRYGTNWGCPPGCGDIAEFEAKIKASESFTVFETVMELEDEFDFETMMEAAETHSSRMPEFAAEIREIMPDCLIMAAGGCAVCPECTYPDAPCRFPEKRFTPMESCLVVAETCNTAGVPYNHGSDHIAYVSCVIF